MAVVCVVAIGIAGGYLLLAEPAGTLAPAPAPVTGTADQQVEPLRDGDLLFRATEADGYGHLATGQPGDEPQQLPLACERVHHAGGRGICLAADRGVVTRYRAITFDERLRTEHELPLSGIPSRARLSPDGRFAATTVFVTGHSYAQGGFSTETTIFDARTGERVVELEELSVTREGRPIRSADFNFWGVTFTPDGAGFYATLSTRGQTYLVQGDIDARSGVVLPGSNVECPSLSPDGSRLVYKKRVDGDGPVTWRLHLRDLATDAEVPLAEARNIDDQVVWLDDDTIAYGLPQETATPTAGMDVWTLDIEAAAPELLVAGASSPAVVSPAPPASSDA